MKLISIDGKKLKELEVGDIVYMSVKRRILLKPVKILKILKPKNYFFFKTKQKYYVQEMGAFSSYERHITTKDKLTKL